MQMKQRVSSLLNQKSWFIRLVYTMILANVVALFIESYAIPEGLVEVLSVFELVSILFFTIEYLLRIWVADLGAKNKRESLKMRINFIFSFYGIVDLLAIVPFFIPLLIHVDLRSIRILRLFRLLRIFKMGRYSKSMKLISDVFRETRSELLVSVFICSILLIFSSTLMYYIESDAQPLKFQNAGDSLWWAVATLTTVGYGDIYPVSPLGKLMGAVIALIGIGFVALPTGIISSSFIAKLNDRRNPRKEMECVCPKCNNTFKTTLDV